ncbi:uncharacterized protein LACBIDRAFT_309011 [Laccaria bicolor S238N-H82]|uniref:Small ribosomal subunit protein mS41 n=1 Tax=Laccaria bicolor (strain S238N-H82 / ATCC MYA-4686) TaxID=486041 RepID=B0CVB7_LACBS|nr:uncharacterized protein LACBIDRAFT_309011 [Laccaria bicolor S238N-H82]EDR13723.1 predicted protein [Laccaria bicolor S238N-H82]|eukprot:XP_001876221.1 predicted protein [Laccaria bicolor S238N-H82]
MSFIGTSASHLCSAIPRLSRSLASAAATRPIPPVGGSTMLPPALLRQRLTIPSASGSIATPSDFLTAIGRASETKLSVESWDQLWRMTGPDMRKAGIAVRDRRFVVLLVCIVSSAAFLNPFAFTRYILWCMEKFRTGIPIEEFAHEPQPKKTIRGWGPCVQNGKRIRSRRLKNK